MYYVGAAKLSLEIIIGASMTEGNQDGPDTKGFPWKNASVAAALVTAVGGVIAAAITVLPNLGGSDGAADANPSKSSTTTAQTPEATPSAKPYSAPPPTQSEPTSSSPTTNRDLEPSVKYLSEMEPISNGSASKGSVNINGTDFTDTISTRIGGCQTKRDIVYSLDRKWRKFETTVGLTSTSDSDAEVYFRMYVDGVQVGPQYKTSKFKSEKVTLDVSNGLELKLNMTFVKGDMGLCSNAGYAAWGSAHLSK